MFRLDYPGVGPEHSFLKDMGRAEYYSVTDEEALSGIAIYVSFLRYVVDSFELCEAKNCGLFERPYFKTKYYLLTFLPLEVKIVLCFYLKL